MSGRDLLYKPQTPFIPTDDDEKGKKPVSKSGGSREIGQVGRGFETPAGRPGGTPAGHRTAKAYRNAYFNKDVGATGQVNQRGSAARALRGETAATDLRKVVLPTSPFGIESPEPSTLRGAGDLMGIDGAFVPDLPSLLQRQSAWTRDKGVTVEMLQARLRHFQQMVADRKAALARMAALPGVAQTPTLGTAAAAQDGAQETGDIAAAGGEIIDRTNARAAPMHQRIAKTLGIKRR